MVLGYKSVLTDLLRIPELTLTEIGERNGLGKSTISSTKNGIIPIFPDAGKTGKTDENELFYELLSDYHEFVENLLRIPELTQQEIAERNGYKNNAPISKIKDQFLFLIPDAGKKNKTDENDICLIIPDAGKIKQTDENELFYGLV